MFKNLSKVYVKPEDLTSLFKYSSKECQRTSHPGM